MSRDLVYPTPDYPQPPRTEAQRVLPVLAMILSSAGRSGVGRRQITKEEIVARLRDLRHSAAVIEWAIYWGVQRGYLETCSVREKGTRQTSHCTVEAKAVYRDVVLITATEKLWRAWSNGELNEPLPGDENQQAGAERALSSEAVSLATRPEEDRLRGSYPQSDSRQEIVLALSGGGLRATLFHLGVLTYLQRTGRLASIKGMVAVSGGSILAAHFLKEWKRAVADDEGFLAVSSELVTFVRLDLRDSVVIPWLWSRLVPWKWCRSSGRTARLESRYRTQFGETLLGEFANVEYPRIAFVATDSIRQERIAFTADRIMKFPINPPGECRRDNPVVTLARGTRLSLAVAASSCFPPVFRRLQLDHSALGLNYSEFKEVLSVNDGGVAGNLGIDVLSELCALGEFPGDTVLVSDAERAQKSKPWNNVLADKDTQGAALSRAERDSAGRVQGKRGVIVRLSDRIPEPPGLPFLVQTRIACYRTDLDAPSWQEIHALVLHGVSAAGYKLDGGRCVEKVKEIQNVIAAIIHKSGAPEERALPNARDLESSHLRPKRTVVLNVVLVVALAFVAVWLVVAGCRWLFTWLQSEHTSSRVVTQESRYDGPMVPRLAASLETQSDKNSSRLGED